MSGISQHSLLTKLRRKSTHDWINLIDSIVPRLKSKFYYPLIFGSFGKGTILYRPIYLGNPKYIHIGSGTLIRPGARLQAVVLNMENLPELRIGNNVNIEQNVHMVAIGKILIGDSVGITANSALLGGTHPFFDVHDPTPVSARLSGADSIIEIGLGCLLGVGCVIQMNVKLGENVIVGSNSVVKSNVDSHCVVNGNPAEVILRYDKEQDRWKRPKQV